MRQPFLPFNGTPFYPCLVVFGAVLALSACSPKQAAPEPVRAVKLMTVGASDLNVQGEYAAEVRARIETRLGFRVPVCVPVSDQNYKVLSSSQKSLKNPVSLAATGFRVLKST